MFKQRLIYLVCFSFSAFMLTCELNEPPECLIGQERCEEDGMGVGIYFQCGEDFKWSQGVNCGKACDGKRCASSKLMVACETEGARMCMDTQELSISFLCSNQNWLPTICGRDSMCDGDVCGATDNSCVEGARQCTYVGALDRSIAFECVDGAWRTTYCAEGVECDGDFCKQIPEPTVIHCDAENGDSCDEGMIPSSWAVGVCEEHECHLVQCRDGYTMINGDCHRAGECCGEFCANCVVNGKVCSSTEVLQGECLTECPVDMVDCGNVCIDPKTSHEFCGADENCKNFERCNSERVCGYVEDLNAYKCVCFERTECEDACFDLNSDVHHCGSCETDCSLLPGWQDGNCTAGHCNASSCISPYSLETSTVDDNEISSCVNINVTECGASKIDCTTTVTGWETGRCEEGVCIPETCLLGYYLNNLVANDVFCAENTVDNCGGVGVRCLDENTECNLETGTCGCIDGYTECDGQCVDLLNDVGHCNSCDTDCSTILVGSTDAVCEEGVCKARDCMDGYFLNGDACEENSSVNCGGNGPCTTDSVLNSASVTCDDGVCKATGCVESYHLYSDICEINDNDNCGEHAIPCQLTSVLNAVAVSCNVVAGICEATVCDTGYHVFDGECEKDDTTNCGSHGQACTPDNVPGSETVSCDTGLCVAESCDSEHIKSGDACIDKNCTDGTIICVETGGIGEVKKCTGNTWNVEQSCSTSCDDKACGECVNGTKQCSSDNKYQVCSDGKWSTVEECTTTVSGAEVTCDKTTGCGHACPNDTPNECNNTCVNTTKDISNCGSCGNLCNVQHANNSCSNSKCSFTCVGDYTSNGKVCCPNIENGDIIVDNQSTCSFTCDSNYHKKSDNSGCELNTITDCGAEHTKCLTATNGSAKCSTSGECSLDCNDGNYPTLCTSTSTCVNTTSDANNCGSCGNVCHLDNATSECVGSSCKHTCVNGFTSNGKICCANVTNGKIKVDNDPTTCNFDCNANFVKSGSSCVPENCVEGVTTCANDGTTGKLYKCISNTLTYQSTCTSSNSCNAEGTGCGSCVDNTTHCDGLNYQTCAQGSWSTTKTCSTTISGATATCDDSSGCDEECPSSNPTTCNNTCVNTTNNTEHCGGCNKPCNVSNATNHCSSSKCSYDCESGYTDNGKICCKDVANATINTTNNTTCSFTCKSNYHKTADGKGCEVNKITDCGSSHTNCPTATNGSAKCSTSGECSYYCNDTTNYPTLCTDTCVNTTNDPEHCGSCTNVCHLDNATASCSGSKCSYNCITGYTTNGKICCQNVANATIKVTNNNTCDFTCKSNFHKTADGKGCEENSITDCGSSHTNCPRATNGSAKCSTEGVCSLYCNNNSYPDLCSSTSSCVDLNKDINNCGTCGHKCTVTNGTPSCNNGTCGVASCSENYHPNAAGTGCEKNSVTDCGASHTTCTNATNGSSQCSTDGECSYLCNNTTTYPDLCDSTCTKLSTDVNNCGTCGNVCTVSHGTPKCSSKKCGVKSCNSNYHPNAAGTDCEVNSITDCGSSHTNCPNATNGSAKCSTEGVCSYFCNNTAEYPDLCESTCVNLDSDVNNCGTCGNKCTATNGTPVCSGGTCSVSGCSANYHPTADGNGCEPNTTSDCGASHTVCSNATNGSAQCSTDGVCSYVCNNTSSYPDLCGSKCVKLSGDVNNCGTCGHKCTISNGTPNCNSGNCGVASCVSNYHPNSAGTGCEQNSITDCGSSHTVCDKADNGSAKCSSAGVCSYDCNNASYPDLCGTTCVDLKNDANNCGTCGHKCTATNGTPVCNNGTCGVSNCSSNYHPTADGNGCEPNTTSDCGASHTVCTNATNGSSQCSEAGVCSYYCNNTTTYPDLCDNTCVKLSSDVNNCGTCGNVCTVSHGTPNCSSNKCGVKNCNSNYHPNAAGTDCEENSITDCGASHTVCTNATNGSSKCSTAGVCSYYCNDTTNYPDLCNSTCVKLSSDVNNCGTCGKKCTVSHGSPKCTSGACGVQSCESNYHPNAAGTNCEVNSITDCGASHTNCPTATHGSAKCSTAGVCSYFCDDTTNYPDLCGTACVNLDSDVNNCGTCGNKCTVSHGTPSCNNGVCGVLSCSSNYHPNAAGTDCEVNSITDCGASHTNCPTATNGSAECSTSGVCSYLCNNTTTYPDLCGTTCTKLSSDVNNCGTCGTKCTVSHGSPKCTSGACGVQSCNSNYHPNAAGTNCEVNSITDCGSSHTNCPTATHGSAKCSTTGVCSYFCNDTVNYPDLCGTACVDMDSDVNNCGTCGNKCTVTNGTPSCDSGVCGIASCLSNYHPNAAGTGCEKNSITDCGPTHEVCSSATNGTAQCSTDGVCSYYCNTSTNPDLCGSTCVNLDSDVNNCGSCGNKCTVSHGTPSCNNGVCGVLSCSSNYHPNAAGTGCEKNSITDCGASHTNCPTATNGSAQCSTSGVCSYYCNDTTNYPNLCGTTCVKLSGDVNNCGNCGTTCTVSHGTPKCTSGTCGVQSCNSNYHPNAAGTDCEVNSITDCGSSHTNCPKATHGSAQCSTAGVCSYYCNNTTTYPDLCGTTCTKLQTDVSNCGTCGNVCTVSHGTPKCTNKTCGVQSCETNYHPNAAGTDCEVNSITDCGSSHTNCPTATHGSAQCSTAGVCSYYCNDTTNYPDLCGTACVKLSDDVNNCGTCGNKCTASNGTPICSNGNCGVSGCSTNYHPTPDGLGCEQNTITDCGSSHTNCPTATNGSAQCSTDGQCSYYCNDTTNFPNLCDSTCVKLSSDVNNCGTCGKKCTVSHGTPKCSNKTCGVQSCETNYHPNSAGTNCEVNSITDCGPSHTTCPKATNGSAQCSTDGKCSYYCEDTTNYPDLCGTACTKLSTDVNNCGTCGNKCTVSHGTPSCTSGKCGVQSCETNYHLNAAGTDCEKNSITDCGPEHTECPLATNGSAQCSTDGKCSYYCNTTEYPNLCDSTCVNLNTDENNCGTCKNVCYVENAVSSCESKVCTFKCNPGYHKTSDGKGCEPNTITDCGPEHKKCPLAENGSAKCSDDGVCTYYCDSSKFPNLCVNTCVNFNSDINNCGDCGKQCSVPNGTPSCNNGTCGVATCDRNYHPTADGTGCEINTIDDCGPSHTKCPLAENGSAQCSTDGVCSYYCDDDKYPDLCDKVCVNKNEDINNCGKCGTICNVANATNSCSSGRCRYTCYKNYCDVSGKCVNNDADHCYEAGCGGCNAFTNGTSSRCDAGLCFATACSDGIISKKSQNVSYDVSIASWENQMMSSEPSMDNQMMSSEPATDNQIMSSAPVTDTLFTPVSQSSREINASVLDSDLGAQETSESKGGFDPYACEYSATLGDTLNGKICCENHPCATVKQDSSTECHYTCSTGYTNCSEYGSSVPCVNLQTNSNHCGSCGNACNTSNNQYCVNGSCITCSGDYRMCMGACVNIKTDNNNCGGCGNKCDSDEECLNGVCRSFNPVENCEDPSAPYDCFGDGSKCCPTAAGCDPSGSGPIEKCEYQIITPVGYCEGTSLIDCNGDGKKCCSTWDECEDSHAICIGISPD